MQRNRCRGIHERRRGMAALVIGFLAASLLPLMAATPGSTETLDRIRQSGTITLGYRTDARPFSYKDEAGKAAGYSVDLCQRIADEVKNELGVSTLTTTWVPLTLEERLPALQQGKVDLLCGADTVTLARRKDVSFSIPVFPGGIGAALRADEPRQLREVLSGEPPTGPIWRASPARILEGKTFSIVAGTTSEKWSASQLDKFQIDATVVPVENYAAGIQSVLDRNSDVFFGERSILLEAAAASGAADDLIVLDRLFTYEPLALPLARGDEDFRLIVDRSLSKFFGSPEFRPLYQKWFGTPDESVITFYRFNILPE